MFVPTILTSLVALLCFGFDRVDALVVGRDVISPPITYPNAFTVWNVGEMHNVTWDTSVIPPGFQSTGMIVLGFLDNPDGTNEHLDLAHPLASGFPITAGRQVITVPNVPTRDSYILVLFGDSGNASGKFTIKNISIGATPSSTAASTGTTFLAVSSAVFVDSGISMGDAASASAGASSLQTPEALPMASSADAVPTVIGPALTLSNAASTGSPATQVAPPAAQSVSPNKIASAGLRTAVLGGAATWLLTWCSVVVAVGSAL